MKTRILIVLMTLVFGFANTTQAQKLSRKKVQITGLKNAKVLGTDVKGNVFDNSEVLEETTLDLTPYALKSDIPFYVSGKNINIDNNNPLKPIINTNLTNYYTKEEVDEKTVVQPTNNKLQLTFMDNDFDIETNTVLGKYISQISGANISCSKYDHNDRIIYSTNICPEGLKLRYGGSVTNTITPHEILLSKGRKGFSANFDCISMANRSGRSGHTAVSIYSDAIHFYINGRDHVLKFPSDSSSHQPETIATQEYVKKEIIKLDDILRLKSQKLPIQTNSERTIVLDKTDNKLKFWNGTEWKIVAFE